MDVIHILAIDVNSTLSKTKRFHSFFLTLLPPRLQGPTLPHQIFHRGMSSLQELHLEHNALASLPHTIGEMGNTVEQLQFHGNYIELLPAELSKFNKLRELNLSSNSLLV
jgi:Leucine-rich repeat (LRR) protein